jgi:hypothetical protein
LPWFISGPRDGRHHGLAHAAIRVEIETRQKHKLSFSNQIVITPLVLNVGTALMASMSGTPSLGAPMAHRRKDQMQPYCFVMKSGEPFAMAGIYARREREEDPATFAILNTDANEVMEPVHDRMPIILPLGHEKKWLPTSGVPYLNQIPAELVTEYPVKPKMNNARYNEPDASPAATTNYLIYDHPSGRLPRHNQ